MQIKEFDIILDIKKYKKIEEIEVVQGDLGTNVFNITLYNELNEYALDGLNIEIAFAKSDGTTVLQSSQDEESPIIIEGDKIICTLKTNTIASPGKVLAEVRLLEDTRLLTSARFELYVRKAIVNDETIESTNEFPILNKLINDVGDIIEAVPVIEGKLDEITNTESELNQSISEGNTLKGDLDSSIQEGNILKVGLDNSIAEGNIVKGELDDIIAGTDFEQVLIELNNKSDKTELENLAGSGRTTETVKDNADKISILNTKVSPETPLTTTSQNLSGAVNEVKDELVAHKAESVTSKEVHGLKIESGIWTPRFGGDSVVGTTIYTNQAGIYYRIGNLVYINVLLRMTSATGGSTYFAISGLPYISNLSSYKFYTNVSQNIDVNIGNIADVYAGKIYFRTLNGTSAVAYSSFDTQRDIYLSGIYRIS